MVSAVTKLRRIAKKHNVKVSIRSYSFGYSMSFIAFGHNSSNLLFANDENAPAINEAFKNFREDAETLAVMKEIKEEYYPNIVSGMSSFMGTRV